MKTHYFIEETDSLNKKKSTKKRSTYKRHKKLDITKEQRGSDLQ